MAHLLQLRVELIDVQPPVWRQITLPDTLMFWDLHCALLLVCDWDGAGQLQFWQGEGKNGEFLASRPAFSDDDQPPVSWQRDARTVPLSEILNAPDQAVCYTCDVDTRWECTVTVEGLAPLPAAEPLPPTRCLAGARATPPLYMPPTEYNLVVKLLHQKAHRQIKKLPKKYADLANFDPEVYPVAFYDGEMLSLSTFVASETEILEGILYEDTRPLPPRKFDFNRLVQNMIAGKIE